MKRLMKTLMITAALALCACASDPHEEMRADAKQVDALAHELAQETQGYCAAAPWTVPAACTDALVSHRAAVAARGESLMEMAERMDGNLRDVGAAPLADTACGVPTVQAEMERHASAACTSNPGTAEVETLQHCAVLTEVAAQLHARANTVLAATGHSVRIGGSGSMPGHLQPLPTGEHAWPWATTAEPVAGPLCAGNS
jgi:hypothetical protein